MRRAKMKGSIDPKQAANERYRKRANKIYHLGPGGKEQVAVASIASRVTKLRARIKAYRMPDSASMSTKLASVLRILGEVDELLADVPKSWRPRPGIYGSTIYPQGTPVRLHPPIAHRWEGMLSISKVYEVAEINGRYVMIDTQQNGETVRLAVPREHLRKASEAA